MITYEQAQEWFSYDNGILYWRAIKSGVCRPLAGNLNLTNGYHYICFNYKRYKRSRLVWLLFNGEFPKDQIDHINHIRNDDRIENLREVSRNKAWLSR